MGELLLLLLWYGRQEMVVFDAGWWYNLLVLSATAVFVCSVVGVPMHGRCLISDGIIFKSAECET